ncbi:MAG: hypothetical protein J7L46_05010 [Bacteroidales bacterium]|nr:hypothetical protein [Bacteroidales bacterium]
MNRKVIKEIAFWGGLGIYLLIIIIFSTNKMSTLRYNAVTIIISDSTQHQFINADDITKILTENKIRIYGTPLDSLNTLKLEKLIKRNNNVIKSIEIFPTYQGKLFVQITQRNPILRIITYNHTSFYIDEDGYLMPFSTKYISRVPVATGNINANLEMFPPDFDARRSPCKFPSERIIHNLFSFSTIIYNDPFWNKNVQQLVIKSENQLIIIPEVGNFIIKFGSSENIKTNLNIWK